MTAAEALVDAVQRLGARGVATPEVDAAWLLADVLGISRSRLALERERGLSPGELSSFDELVQRRAAREPLAYILGEWGFRRLRLKVDARGLIPRPETEAVVERCLARLTGLERPAVLDVGTGSGAIALAIADEHPTARVTAFDNSRRALALAGENLQSIGLRERVRLVEHDLACGLGADAFDLVVSNPPYVDVADLDGLEPEVRDWEPRPALVGNGHTAGIARAALAALRRGGWLVVEVGDGQADAVRDLFQRTGFQDVQVSQDLTGRRRVVEGRRP